MNCSPPQPLRLFPKELLLANTKKVSPGRHFEDVFEYEHVPGIWGSCGCGCGCGGGGGGGGGNLFEAATLRASLCSWGASSCALMPISSSTRIAPLKTQLRKTPLRFKLNLSVQNFFYTPLIYTPLSALCQISPSSPPPLEKRRDPRRLFQRGILFAKKTPR